MLQPGVDLSDLCPKCLGDGKCYEHDANAQRKAQQEAARRRKKTTKVETGNGNGKSKSSATSRRSPKVTNGVTNGRK